MAVTTRYTLLGSGANFMDFYSPYGALSLDGETIAFKGSSGVDQVYVGSANGLSFDFSQAGAGVDKVYLSGNWADYSKVVSGTTLILTRISGGNEVVKVGTGDNLIFANGYVSVADAISNTNGALPSMSLNTGETTASYPVSVAGPLNNTVRAVVLDATGETIATTRPGVAMIVKGGSGVDVVYVNAGTQVDASQLGAGTDKVYLMGSFADYLGTISGTNVTLTRTVGSDVEIVKILGGTAGSHDTLVFADGTTTTNAVYAYWTAPTQSTLPVLSNSEMTPLPVPTVAITSNLNALHIGSSASITFTLSAPSSDFAASDVTVTGGTLTNFTAVNSTVYTATLTPLDGSTSAATISVPANTFVNTVTGMSNATSPTLNIAVDTVIDTPTVSLTHDTGVVASDHITADASLTLSAPASDVTRTVTVDGGQAGASYTAPNTDGSHTVVVTDTDAAGNVVTSQLTFTLDTAAPTISEQAAHSGTKTIELVYSENLDVLHLPAASAFTVTTGGVANTVTDVSVIGSVVTLTLANSFAPGVVTVTYNDPTTGNDLNALQDLAGNDASSFTSGVLADGYVRGADVYIDVNGNGQVDQGVDYYVGKTDSFGNFFIPASAPTGTIMAVGGFNTDTGVANTLPLKAPAGSTTINPLTTLVQAVVDASGGTTSAAAAAQTVASNLGLTLGAGQTLTSYDPISAGDLTAQKAAAQVATIVSLASNGDQATSATVIGNIATTIQNAAPSAVVSLSDSAVLASALTGVTADLALQSSISDASAAIHSATNITAVAAVQSQYLDTVAPNAPTLSTIHLTTNQSSPTLTVSMDVTDTTGHANVVGDQLVVRDGGVQVATYTLQAADIVAGHVSLTLTGLTDGLHNLSVAAIDQAGNASPLSPTLGLVVDTVAPVVPVINVVADHDIIGIATQGSTLTGSAEANSTLTLSVAGNISTLAVDANGSWSHALTAADLTAIGQGNASISATATDAAGNVSTSATRSLFVDTVAPTALATIASGYASTNQAVLTSGSSTNDNTPTLQGQINGTLGANEFVEVYVDGVAAGSVQVTSGSWSFTSTSLGNAVHSFTARVEDSAGNAGTSSAAFSLSVNASIPSATASFGVSSANSNQPGGTLSGTLVGSLQAGETVVLYDGTSRIGSAVTNGNQWTFTPVSPLSDGVHHLSAVVEASGGNQGSASASFTLTVDSVAPNTPAINVVAGDNVINSTETGALISGTAESGSTLTLNVGGNVSTLNVAGNGTWSHVLNATDLTALGQGNGTINAVATDAAGNASSAATRSVLVDTVTPAAPTLAGVAGDNRINNAELQAGVLLGGTAEAGVRVDLTLAPNNVRNAVTDGSGHWSIALSASDVLSLGQGNHTLSATATDAAGNISAAATRSVLTDSVAPLLSALALAPSSDTGVSGDGKGNVALPTLQFTAEAGSSVQLSVDGGAYQVAQTATGSLQTLASTVILGADGAHTLTVQATDLAGNTTLRSIGYVLDSTAPIVGTVAANLSGMTPRFTATQLLADGGNARGGSYAVNWDAGPSHVTVADVNNDGKSDLIITYNDQLLNMTAYQAGGWPYYANGYLTNSTSVFLGNGDGTFGPEIPHASTGGMLLALADVNHDGQLDLITEGGGTLSVQVGYGNGVFDTPVFSPINVAVPTSVISSGVFTLGPQSMAVADVNGDGNLDVVSTYGAYSGVMDYGVVVQFGNGTGQFTSGVGTSVGGVAEAYVLSSAPAATGVGSQVVLGDLNGDGKLDIVTSNFSGQDLSILLNIGSVALGTGNAHFASPVTINLAGANMTPRNVALGDVNGDGKLDIVTTSDSVYGTTVSVFLGHGDGTFGTRTDFNSPVARNDALSISDINGDGKLDIVTTGAISDVGGDSRSVWFGDGHGGFANPVNYPGVTTGSQVVTDLNGDGLPDIVTVTGRQNTLSNPNSPLGYVSVMINQGEVISAGQSLDWTVHFDSVVNVNCVYGTPTMSLGIGSGTGVATYLSGSGTQDLTFRYTAQAGDTSSSGIQVSGMNLNGATIQDVAGNNAVVTLHNVTGGSGVNVDAIAPPAPTLALAVDTGSNTADSITSNGQVNVGGLEANASWQYSTNSGVNWSNGSGSSFVLYAGDYSAGQVQVRQADLAGNTSIARSAGPLSVDVWAPLVQQVSAADNQVTLTLDSAPDPAVMATMADFSVSVSTGGVTSQAIVSSVTYQGTQVILTLSAPLLGGEAVTVAYGGPSGQTDTAAVQDLAGNLSVAFSRTVTAASTIPPVLTASSVDGASVTLTFSEALDAANTGSLNAFAVAVNGSARSVSGMVVNGNTVTLTLASAVFANDTVNLTYTDPTTGNDASAIQDLVGNDLASTGQITVTNQTQVVSFVSASITGSTVTMLYNGPLDAAHQPDMGNIGVQVNGQGRGLNNVAVVGNTVVLTLGAEVAQGDTVTLSYRDQTGNDVYAIQDLAGNDAASLANTTSVTNLTTTMTGAPSVVSATFSETGTTTNTVTLTFNHPMQIAGTNPSITVSKLDANGVATLVSSTAALSGETLTLTTSGTTLSATDTLLVNFGYNGTGGLTDTVNQWPTSTNVIIGGSGASAINLNNTTSNVWDARIFGNEGADTITAGGAGVSLIAGGGGADVITSGWGDNTIRLNDGSTGRVSDILKVDMGTSSPLASDKVFGFDTTNTPGATNLNDILALPSGVIAANTTGFANGADVAILSNTGVATGNSIMSHSISSGVVTFATDNAGNTPVLINSGNIKAAVQYLDTNLGVGQTAAFNVDTDGNGYADTLFAFQKTGSQDPYNNDILVGLRGVQGATLGTTAGAHVVQIADGFGPTVSNPTLSGNGIVLQADEVIQSVDFTGFTLQHGHGANALTAMTVNTSSTGPDATDPTKIDIVTGDTLAAGDFVLVTHGSNLGTLTDASATHNTSTLFDPNGPTMAAIGGVGAQIDLSAQTVVANIIAVSGGNNTLVSSSAGGYVNSGSGNDVLTGGAGNDNLNGGAGNDILNAGNGVNQLNGGTGADTMTGGTGVDHFVFNQGDSPVVTFAHSSANASATAIANGDTFTFAGGAGDVIAGGMNVTGLNGDSINFWTNSVNVTTPNQMVNASGQITLPSSGLTADQQYFVVQGDYSNGTFTVNASTGHDSLVVYDGNASSAVTQTGLVIQGIAPSALTETWGQIYLT